MLATYTNKTYTDQHTRKFQYVRSKMKEICCLEAYHIFARNRSIGEQRPTTEIVWEQGFNSSVIIRVYEMIEKTGSHSQVVSSSLVSRDGLFQDVV